MVKVLLIKVSRIERWKRLLSRGENKQVWIELESFRAGGGDHGD